MRLKDSVSMVEELYDGIRSRVVWRVHLMTGIILVSTSPPDLHVGDDVSIFVEKASTIEAPNKSEGA